MMRLIPAFILLSFIFTPISAHALCSSPPGGAGDQIYNSSHNVMQYCNGNQWIAMGSGGGGGGGSDTLGNLSCNNGESVEYDGTNWGCVPGKVSRTGDTMTGTLTLSPPTAGTHAATKAYVDAAIAGVAGASGGGGGATCYYTNSNCGSGFDQMPGAYGGSNICCTGGGSLIDEMPSTFDFPASPAIAYNAGHTWTPIEISGFESASVSIQATAQVGTAEFRICADSACSNVLKGWRNTSTGIASGNYLQIRIGPASRIRSDGSKITVTVGGMTDDAPITNQNGPYFLAFVSSGVWTGAMGGLSGADNKCETEAINSGWPGTWRAWLSSSTVSAGSRFENAGTTAKFYMPNGTKLVDNWNDLTDGNLDAPLNGMRNGSTASNADVWTNTNWNGALYYSNTDNSCGNWTSASGNNTYGGRTNVATSDWTTDGQRVCSSSFKLYCFQTVLPN